MPAICSICNRECTECDVLVKCSGPCERHFHQDCTQGEGRRTRSGKNWKCIECRSTEQESVSSGEGGVNFSKDFLLRVMNEFKNEVFSELKSFKEEMNELTKSTEFVSNKIDTSNSLMCEIREELAALKKENAELRKKNTALEVSVIELQDKVRSLEQYSRRNNVEVSGIPVTPQENVNSIVKDVGKALGVEVLDHQISAAHRIPTYRRDRVPSLVVQFSSRAIKDSWISNYKSRRGALTANNVNSAYPASKLYINEHLSPENKIFFAAIKRRCQDIGYAYAWCRDGKFFVRKANGDKCIKINKISELDKLK